MSEEKLVPKLRFNGFDDEWSTYKLSELSEQVKRKKENITDKDNILTISANKGFISQKERWDNVIAGKSLKKYTYLKKDEFSYNRGNSKSFKYGCIYRLNYENALVPNVYHSFKITNGNINFFEQLFKSNKLDKQLIKIITSTARMDGLLNISAKNFFNIDVNISNNLKEQKLIGDFLKLIDIKIELLESKYENYLNFKKYLMQQIFAQKLRFKDENNNYYDNWEKLQLKDIISINGGYAFKSELFKDEGMPIIRISNISPNNSVILDDIVYYDKLDNDSDFIIRKGELIIAMSGATTGKVAVYDLNHEAYINQRVGLFKQTSDELYYPFLVQYTHSDDFKRELKKTLVAGAQPNISKKEIESFNIRLPQYEEQQKIADTLSNLDLKINTIKKQNNEISMFKKSLLQQMFV